MSPILHLLLDRVFDSGQSHEKYCLILAEDNTREEDLALFSEAQKQFKGLTLLTNRYDIHRSAQNLAIDSYFSDFDFTAFKQRFDLCLLRIAKERALNHHIFNELQNTLTETGQLLLGGKKSEGIKGYHQKLTKTCGYSGSLIKNKDVYVASLIPGPKDYSLDDKRYHELRKVDHFVSKPGVYGWDKVDAGSAFLITEFLGDENIANNTFKRAIDLGCGYGFLSLALLEAIRQNGLSVETLVATDNNAAAIEASTQNISLASKELNIETQVVADDCGKFITERFDLMLCNPPFHQGFDTAKPLSEKFVRQASQLLTPGGVGYFVVNIFIPLESLAKPLFKEVTTIANNGQFKVIRLLR